LVSGPPLHHDASAPSDSRPTKSTGNNGKDRNGRDRIIRRIGGQRRSGVDPQVGSPRCRSCHAWRADFAVVVASVIVRGGEVCPWQKTPPQHRNLSGANASVAASSSRFWDQLVRLGFVTAIFVDAPTAQPFLPTREFRLNGTGSLLVKIRYLSMSLRPALGGAFVRVAGHRCLRGWQTTRTTSEFASEHSIGRLTRRLRLMCGWVRRRVGIA
jgi:hypothetical protein